MGHAQAWATDQATVCTPAGATTPKSVTAESTDKSEKALYRVLRDTGLLAGLSQRAMGVMQPPSVRGRTQKQAGSLRAPVYARQASAPFWKPGLGTWANPGGGGQVGVARKTKGSNTRAIFGPHNAQGPYGEHRCRWVTHIKQYLVQLQF